MISAAKERNSFAMANLIMAFETDNLFGMIYKTMSAGWPGGLAHEVVVLLFNKYSPDDRISRVELRKMLNGVSIKEAEDPNILFEQVSAIQNRYDTDAHQIEEEELIAVVMGDAPEKHLSVITCEQRAKGNQMSLHDLEVVMYQLWRQLKHLQTHFWHCDIVIRYCDMPMPFVSQNIRDFPRVMSFVPELCQSSHNTSHKYVS
jgi:hypothetical protein